MTGYARVDFDTVAPLMPFDKTASQVSARGEHFDWKAPDDVLHTSDPIPTRGPNREELSNPQFVDLSGKRIGRFTVVGIAEVITTNGQNWTVRCVCGSYETKKAKTLKAWISGDVKGSHEPMCGWCSNNQRLLRGQYDARKAAAAVQAIREMSK